MLYITGIHALNLPCSLYTCGDWHMPALNWSKLTLKESNDSTWEDYGIEQGKKIPGHTELFAAANHIRAILDLIEDGRFDLVQGMNKDFIGNDNYNEEIFEQVGKLRQSPAWKDIYNFMHKEYGRKWRLWNGKVNTQADELIDTDKLAEDFLNMYDRLGLLISEEEKEELLNIERENIPGIKKQTTGYGLKL